MQATQKDYKKHIATGLLLTLGLFLVYLLRIFFLALFGAYIFSFMFSAVYIWLKRRTGKDEVAAFLTVVMILVVALGPLLLICYTAFNQALALQDRIDSLALTGLLGKLAPSLRVKVELALLRATENLASTLTCVLPFILRGALTYRLNADCPSCPTGVDLQLTKDSIPIFADLVVANCRQVAQNVFNATGFPAGAVSNYEDLWRFTLANYHVGSGCLSYALFTAWKRSRSLDGDEVASRFTEPCSSAIPYVQNIARLAP